MSISRDEVIHVARLARLELTEEEIDLFRTQLGAVLDRARRIQSLELDEVTPTAHPIEMTNVLREDTTEPPDPPDPILANAPERDGALFRVPKILEDEA